ncbi:hypothetical protein GCM10025779_00640 [Arthrobacter cryoconiti]
MLASGIRLCHDCTTTLEYHLEQTVDVWANLQITLERRDVGAASVGLGGAASAVEPLNLDAHDIGYTLQTILTGWAQHIPAMRPASTQPHILATWMRQPAQIKLIRGMDWAADLIGELEESLNKCREATDRSLERISLGHHSTECPGKVRAIAGARWGRCTECRERFEAATQHQWMISEAWHVTAPLPHIIRALRTLHVFVKPKDAENWAARHKLISCISDDGAKTYQLKQVYDVHQTMVAKRERVAAQTKLKKQARLDAQPIAA